MTVEQYPALSALVPVAGAVALPHCDSVDIAIASLQAGLTSFCEYEGIIAIVKNNELPALAAPYCTLDVTDVDARTAVLLEDLIPKIQALLNDSTPGLVLTGHCSAPLINVLLQMLSIPPEDLIHSETTLASLQQWQDRAAENPQRRWLWLSVHAGCNARLLIENQSRLACAERSEGILSTDLAVAILLEAQVEGATFKLVTADEPAAENPLENKPVALTRLLENFEKADERDLLQSMQNRTQTAIEFYKLQQNLRSPKPEPPLPIDNRPVEYQLSSLLGELGVCALSLQLLIQHHWKEPVYPLAIANEGSQRMIWSPIRAENSQEIKK
ncbi:MAG: hypothetical protein P8X74_00775 [Reinekea sp.]|jgi:hypothetical protein